MIYIIILIVILKLTNKTYEKISPASYRITVIDFFS